MNELEFGVATARTIARLHTAERAKTYARNARAEATRRAYESDLRDFVRYCTHNKLEAFPATPQTVALYLADLAGKLNVSTAPARRCDRATA